MANSYPGAVQVGVSFANQYYNVLQQKNDIIYQFYDGLSSVIRVDGELVEKASEIMVRVMIQELYIDCRQYIDLSVMYVYKGADTFCVAVASSLTATKPLQQLGYCLFIQERSRKGYREATGVGPRRGNSRVGQKQKFKAYGVGPRRAIAEWGKNRNSRPMVLLEQFIALCGMD